MTPGKRPCAGTTSDFRQCRAAAMTDEEYCFRHSPAHRDAALEASRLGGARRRKEATIAVVYDFSGLTSWDDLLRLLELSITETLALENGVQRNKTLVYAVSVARHVLRWAGIFSAASSWTAVSAVIAFLPRMISLMTWAGRPIASASSRCVISRTSSSSASNSPGCTNRSDSIRRVRVLGMVVSHFLDGYVSVAVDRQSEPHLSSQPQ